jgi:hypothetical protein
LSASLSTLPAIRPAINIERSVQGDDRPFPDTTRGEKASKPSYIQELARTGALAERVRRTT